MGMREREGGGEGGGGVTRDELENELAGRSTLNQRHRCADLPSSWWLTSRRTHSLPKTLVFRGFTSHQLGLSSLTLGPPVDTAFMAMDTSELPRQGANLSANRVDFSSPVTPASPPVPTRWLRASERGWKCQRNNMNKPAHVPRLWG